MIGQLGYTETHRHVFDKGKASDYCLMSSHPMKQWNYTVIHTYIIAMSYAEDLYSLSIR